jgi:hypothetical protein
MHFRTWKERIPDVPKEEENNFKASKMWNTGHETKH